MSDNTSSIEKANVLMSDNVSIDNSKAADDITSVRDARAIKEDAAENFIRKDIKWWKTPHLIKLNLWLMYCTLASTNNGYDSALLNGLQSLESWHDYFNPERDQVMLGAMTNGTIFGALLSLPLAPYLCDRFGRRGGLLFGDIIMIIGSILQGVSTNYAFFLCARIVLGFGNGFMLVATPSLMSEIAFPSHRAVATCFYNTCWFVGAFISAWIIYGTNALGANNYSWRIPSYLQAVAPVAHLSLLYFAPESPRYWVSRGKFDKAEQMLNKYHIGYSDHPTDKALVACELREIQTAIELENLNTKSSYMDFIRLKNFRKRTFLVVFSPMLMQLSGNNLISYYLNKVLNSIGITDASEQLKINGILMVFNWVVSMAAAAVSNKFRRRTMFLTSLTLSLISYTLWTLLSALATQRGYPKSLANGVLAFVFLFYASYNIGFNGLPFLYATEVLPYTHRAKGLNLFGLVQNVSLIFNGYVNPVAMEAIDWKYYIVWTCYLAFELVVVYFFFPETRIHKNVTLEEIGEIFGDPVADGDEVLIRDAKVEVEHKS